MKFTQEVADAIRTASEQYGIAEDILVGIVFTESGGRMDAKRYEPAFYSRYTQPMDLETKEERDRATSWGLMQIMGETAREGGFQGEFEDILTDAALAMDLGCGHLITKRDLYFERYGWDGVFAAYNAGKPRANFDGTFRNQEYVDRVNKFRRPLSQVTIV